MSKLETGASVKVTSGIVCLCEYPRMASYRTLRSDETLASKRDKQRYLDLEDSRPLLEITAIASPAKEES